MDATVLVQLKAELRIFEAERAFPYDDASGKPPLLSMWHGAQLVPSVNPRTGRPGQLTIGVGRNLSAKPLSPAAIDFLLTEDILEALEPCYRLFEHFDGFSPNRQVAIASMAFNLGEGHFLTFRKMIRAVRAGNWPEAARQALDSAWAKQVQPERVARIVEQLRDG